MRRRHACSAASTYSEARDDGRRGHERRASGDWHRHFSLLADEIDALLADGEVALTSLSAEDSDFVRFNAGKVRQTGRVRRAS